MTHDELVQRAGRWLSNSRGCVLVLLEAQCWAVNEFPDAIGWNPRGHSVLVECKVSRDDFRRDKHKPSKHGRRETMGRERWYLTPPGLLTKLDMPDGCGLIELRGARVVVVHGARGEERPGREAAELPLLINVARKEAWSRGWQGRCVRLAAKFGEKEPEACA